MGPIDLNNSKEVELGFLIADLSGYTALTEAHGNMSAVETVTRYTEIVEATLVPGTRLAERVGDEVLIVGADAANLVRTAIRLRDKIEDEPLFPTLHAGLHGGSVLVQDGHYFGRALNLASRVAAHARGNQILCTQQVVHLAGEIKEVEYRTLGSTRFKNIPDPVEIFEVVSRPQGAERIVIDPVCRMQVRQDRALARLPFGGKTYAFCSFECAKLFANHPERYVGR